MEIPVSCRIIPLSDILQTTRLILSALPLAPPVGANLKKNCQISEQLPDRGTECLQPNNDGLNDLLYRLDAYKAIHLDFKVFDRWGRLLFETRDWTKKWDGIFNGVRQAAGVYVWMLKYTDDDHKRNFPERNNCAYPVKTSIPGQSNYLPVKHQ